MPRVLLLLRRCEGSLAARHASPGGTTHRVQSAVLARAPSGESGFSAEHASLSAVEFEGGDEGKVDDPEDDREREPGVILSTAPAAPPTHWCADGKRHR